MRSGQEHIEYKSQSVDIGGGRHRLPEQLLRRCVLRCQRRGARARQCARSRLIVEQLRDTEVEELDHTLARDKDVGGLDIPVHDQMTVRMSHRGQDIKEQADACLDVQFVPFAKCVDGLALDKFQDEVRLRALQHPRVQESRNIRMIEAAEEVPFDSKTLLASAADPGGVHKFDGDRAFIASIRTPRTPDAAHATATNLGVDYIRTDRAPDQRCGAALPDWKSARAPPETPRIRLARARRVRWRPTPPWRGLTPADLRATQRAPVRPDPAPDQGIRSESAIHPRKCPPSSSPFNTARAWTERQSAGIDH